MMPLNKLCVFCGASQAASPTHFAAANIVGKEVAKRHLKLVYGGALCLQNDTMQSLQACSAEHASAQAA